MSDRVSWLVSRALIGAGVWMLATAPRAAHARQDGASFQTADRCMACHNGLVTPSGADVSIGSDWRASMMANSARDPYWQAAVRRETLDRPAVGPAIEAECAKCHMPMTQYTARVDGAGGGVFAHLPVGAPTLGARLAADGVSCTVCHQIRGENLGTEESFVGGFEIASAGADGSTVFGPFHPDSGRATIMRSASGFQPARASHLQTSEMCATCHTLYTHSLDADGNVIGELPEQVPYLEWRHSAYRDSMSCQTCHMPVVSDSVAVAAVLGLPRPDVNRHVFRGGNFFVLRMLNRYRADLGVTALPQELDASVTRTIQHLQTNTATLRLTRIAIENGVLEAVVAIENLAGHKLPTAYPSRRAWLHVTVRDRDGRTIFESGALDADGRITGNDNDRDPGRYEPHYDVIDRPDAVQIYEPILGGPDGTVTTGLLTATQYLKDNRLLPRGFDKSTAHEDIAVYGGAGRDENFRAGGDQVVYRVPLRDAPGPFLIEVGLWYQPIGFRWADNLRAYDALETNRFVTYYDAMSTGSAVRLTEARAAASR